MARGLQHRIWKICITVPCLLSRPGFSFITISQIFFIVIIIFKFNFNLVVKLDLELNKVWCSTYNLDLEPFIGFFLSAYVLGVGVLSIYTGLVKSVKLEKLRKEVVKQGTERVSNMAPASGFHFGSFNEFSLQMTSHMTPKVQFTEEEYNYISSALSFKVNSDGVIDPAEFRNWTVGSMTIL